MKLYAYNTDSREIVAIINGNNNAACESKASDEYGDTDVYGWTCSPAIGAADGLIETADQVEIEA